MRRVPAQPLGATDSACGHRRALPTSTWATLAPPAPRIPPTPPSPAVRCRATPAVTVYWFWVDRLGAVTEGSEAEPAAGPPLLLRLYHQEEEGGQGVAYDVRLLRTDDGMHLQVGGRAGG